MQWVYSVALCHLLFSSVVSRVVPVCVFLFVVSGSPMGMTVFVDFWFVGVPFVLFRAAGLIVGPPSCFVLLGSACCEGEGGGL